MARFFIDKQRMIALVRERPILWDPRKEEYRVRSLRDDSWEEVAKELFGERWYSALFSEHSAMLYEIKKTWRNCRDQMKKELARRKSVDTGASRKRPYYLAKSLMFLQLVPELRPTAANIQVRTNPATQSESNGSTMARSPLSGHTAPHTGGKEVYMETSTTAGPSQVQRPVCVPTHPHRAIEEPLVGRLVHQQVLDFLHGQRQLDWADCLGQCIAASIRQLQPEIQLQLQTALLTVVNIADDPARARMLFRGINQYAFSQSLPSEMMAPHVVQPPSPTQHGPYNAAGPSGFYRQAQYGQYN